MSSKDPSVMAEPSTSRTPEQKAKALVEWFTDHRGQLSDHVQIAFSDSRGYHMRAVSPLTSPVVVTCPLKLTLSCLNLDPKQKEVQTIVSCLQPCQGKIADHILTYMLLIEQRNKGTESPWYNYIACLPGSESMTTPLWFDDEDMAFLAGTSLAPASLERKTHYREQWEQAVTVLRDNGVALADTLDFESLLWAATIFTSRAFISTHILPDHETVPILFPVVDILNHSVSAKVEWDFQPHASFSLKLLEGETFVPGQELFNNYAPKQNDELLLGYGFCLENNPIEQFPLKLAFPPMLQEYAQAVDLLEPEKVPFGMSIDFSNKDLNNEQHFLRAKGHPFGRYDNLIPFFRGIPPYIVCFFFIQTLFIEYDVDTIDVSKPGPRITLQVLTLLHQALEQRSQTLPLSSDRQPQNDKQKYAKTYRDSQARIIHSVRLELQTTIDRLRPSRDEEAIPIRTILLTPSEALTLLAAGSSSDRAQHFQSGISKHNLSSPASENLTWTLLLLCFAAYSLTQTLNDNSLITDWLRTLYTRHPLPSLEDGIEDADTYTFVDENLSDFLTLPGAADVLQRLDTLGDTYVAPKDERPALIVSDKPENLGARLIMWAMSVAEGEAVSVLLDGVARKCILFEPWSLGDENAAWMYTE